MRFHADLHVHSKYSRATSRDLDLEHLAHWAARKGIGVIATGDFTHPAWSAELREKLVPAEPGLFRLRDDIEKSLAATLPAACQTPVRFMLEVEISTIYKKGEKTRKIHHLIYAPDFSTVEHISTRLARIGNIASDGRPILGLDSRDLLEITLEAGPDAYLIPAHIWTPWFAALGSQSGFDSITECYGDLADNIFAVETGLSSDPAMNWRVSFLDRYRLVSNSDAHSPGKLGREATTFDCEIDYFAIRDALKTGRGYVGTVEFFPEEGKYHLDGHRKCGVRLTPSETLAHGGCCPVCGQPVTIGVDHRVETLADREPANLTPPPTAGAVSCLVPLPEVLSEIHTTGPTSKSVERDYDQLVAKFGSELFILQSAPVEDVARATSSLLGEALTRLRAGRVIRHAGYDGEYGVIQLFEDGELKRITCGTLFDAPTLPTKNNQSVTLALQEIAAPALPSSLPIPPRWRGDSPLTASDPKIDRIEAGSGDSAAAKIIEKALAKAARETEHAESATKLHCSDPPPSGASRTADSSQRSNSFRKDAVSDSQPQPTAVPPTPRFQENGQEKPSAPGLLLARLDADQRRAAALVDGPMLIIAGPGSGKTRTLTHRIAHIISDHATALEQCLAITFTRRAAEEMRARLTELLGERATQIPIHTFHSLGLLILRQRPAAAGLNAGFRIADSKEQTALLARAIDLPERKINAMLRAISRAKRCGTDESAVAEAMAAYQCALSMANTVDFDDLIRLTVDILGADPDLCQYYRERFRFISVDEFQDLDEQQYRLLKLLAPADANVCVIGDPDQAIYGFRGAEASYFDRFQRDHPNAVTVRLVRNYRSSATIVTASTQVMAAGRPATGIIEVVRDMHRRISIHAAASERAEAEFVVAAIERLIGGHNFFSLDSGRADGCADNDLSFADIAVLYRTDDQSAALVTAFERSGMPFKKHGHALLTGDEGTRALLRELDGAGDIEGVRPIMERLKAAAARLEQKTLDQAGTSLTVGPALQRLTTLATRFGADQQLSDALALGTDADLFDPRADRVSLLTLHAAKGLEFPVVFIVGLEDGLLPLYWNELDTATAAEERRLFYVGMTRAKDQLVLTRALKRTWRGRLRKQCVSPFLADIESALLDHRHNETTRRHPQDQQLSLF
jgi:DNA helicase II / ATP-dependent DNA helicase PcrA